MHLPDNAYWPLLAAFLTFVGVRLAFFPNALNGIREDQSGPGSTPPYRLLRGQVSPTLSRVLGAVCLLTAIGIVVALRWDDFTT